MVKSHSIVGILLKAKLVGQAEKIVEGNQSKNDSDRIAPSGVTPRLSTTFLSNAVTYLMNCNEVKTPPMADETIVEAFPTGKRSIVSNCFH